MHAVVEATTLRQISGRSRGHTKGPITRLMSPGDLGEYLKPFVFLDDFKLHPGGPAMAGMHPHSGIATVTVVLSGAMDYADSTGAEGTLAAGGVEWMRAGGGVWHGGGAMRGAGIEGFQLWVALPPELENSPAFSQYLAPAQVPSDGPVRVILGRYGKARSAIDTGMQLNYLHVRLRDGEPWRYVPPTGHTVAWVAVANGELHAGGTVLQKEIALFEESEAALDFIAQGETEFVLGSAVKHPHPLVLGYYSVHTSAAALQRGEAGIERIRHQLQT
jgi:redox-sensitive bicupin YhaK (pirin superfamily)